MSVCGQDFVDFAKECFKGGNEIAYRNTIGRSYYGLYHSACEILSNCPPTSHSGVSDYLYSTAWKGNEPYGIHECKALSIMLQQQHSKRKHADYNLGMTISREDASEALKMTEKAIHHILKMKK